MYHEASDTLTLEECRTLEGKFVERTQRLSALFALDKVLSDAANQYNLAAQIVHHGWPHRAD